MPDTLPAWLKQQGCRARRVEAKDRAALAYIRERLAETGTAPTRRELMGHLGIRSSATMQVRIERLIAHGLLTRDRYQPGSLRLVEGPTPEALWPALRALATASLVLSGAAETLLALPGGLPFLAAVDELRELGFDVRDEDAA